MPFENQRGNINLQKNSKLNDSASDMPTHALYANRAIAIKQLHIRNKPALNGARSVVNTLVMDIDNLPESLARIEQRGNTVYLKTGAQQVFLNDNPVTGEKELKLGDRIQFVKNGDAINLIQVNNG